MAKQTHTSSISSHGVKIVTKSNQVPLNLTKDHKEKVDMYQLKTEMLTLTFAVEFRVLISRLDLKKRTTIPTHKEQLVNVWVMSALKDQLHMPVPKHQDRKVLRQTLLLMLTNTTISLSKSVPSNLSPKLIKVSQTPLIDLLKFNALKKLWPRRDASLSSV